jgi:succinate dehydrogenase / fumarate reductase cytochrome b subunit
MSRLARLSRTSLGKKLWMSLSGLMLVLFLVGHLAGNLKLLQGPDALNDYAAWLQGHPLLWVLRAGLLGAFVLHVGLGIALARENRVARPIAYKCVDHQSAGVVERHMVLSGVLVLAFLVYHLLHLTLGVVDPAIAAALVDNKGQPDVYARVVLGFANPWVSASYLVGLVVLGVHLKHAIRSVFQTLGASHESYQAIIHTVAWLVPALISTGFAALPVLVLSGAVSGVPR